MGIVMLPFIVEYELMGWYNITRDILGFITVLFVLCLARKSSDETWIRENFAHVVSLFLLVWIAVGFLGPFIAMGALYPDLTWEIGGYILNFSGLLIATLVFVIIILQTAHYLGFFRTEKRKVQGALSETTD